MKKTNFSVHPVGCSGLVCYFGNTISTEVNDLVHSFTSYIKVKMGGKLTGIVPSYHSVTCYYDPIDYSFFNVKNEIEKYYQTMLNTGIQRVQTIFEIPVCYGGEYGPDIEQVARHNEISVDLVIQKHQENLYRIYMIGFLPGFPYLGGLDPILATPRLIKPKLVNAGAVGIAREQTGIYPFQSPGGWNIIGQTPISIFSPNNQKQLFQPGDFLRFRQITESEYEIVKASCLEGDYLLKKEVLSFE